MTPRLASVGVVAVVDFVVAAVVADFAVAAACLVPVVALAAGWPVPAVAMVAAWLGPAVECRAPVVGCHVLAEGCHGPVADCRAPVAGCQVEPGHRSAVPPHSVAPAAVARDPVLVLAPVRRCNPEEVVPISRRGRGPRRGLQRELVQVRESDRAPVLELAQAPALEAAGVLGSHNYLPGCRV